MDLGGDSAVRLIFVFLDGEVEGYGRGDIGSVRFLGLRCFCERFRVT